jgi:hypothetical protein
LPIHARRGPGKGPPDTYSRWDRCPCLIANQAVLMRWAKGNSCYLLEGPSAGPVVGHLDEFADPRPCIVPVTVHLAIHTLFLQCLHESLGLRIIVGIAPWLMLGWMQCLLVVPDGRHWHIGQIQAVVATPNHWRLQ